jgi:phage major head subunit gpT-like protein
MEAMAYADKIAMTVPSVSKDESYGWLGQFPSMREWIGPRQVKNLAANECTDGLHHQEPQVRGDGIGRAR